MSKYNTERLELKTATIAISTTKSSAIDCLGKTLVGLEFPAIFTGTAGKIHFEVSFDNVTFKQLYNSSGALVEPTVIQDKFMGLALADFQGTRYFKIVGVSQAAEREIKCILRGN